MLRKTHPLSLINSLQTESKELKKEIRELKSIIKRLERQVKQKDNYGGR